MMTIGTIGIVGISLDIMLTPVTAESLQIRERIASVDSAAEINICCPCAKNGEFIRQQIHEIDSLTKLIIK